MPDPASWSPEQIAAVTAFRAGLGESDPVKVRNAMAQAPPAAHPDTVSLRPVDIPRVPVPGLEESASGHVVAEWLEPKGGADKDAPVMIYYHGGGYCIMSPQSHRGITGGVAAHGVRVLSVDYRMAPEDPHPAAVVDALAAYKYVLSLGVPPSKIVLAGDSAGGGLTYATAIYLRDNPTFAPQVAGLAPISPWIDLTASSPTDILRDEFDSCIISAGQSSTEGMRFAYAGGKDKHPHKAKEPTFSPLFDFKKEKLPPAITSLATVDRLLGMDLAYYIRKLGEGETVQVDIYEDQFHVFQFLTFLKQTDVCLKRMADFTHQVTTNPGSIKTQVNHISYDGSIKPIENGHGKLKEMLRALNERAEKIGWVGDGKEVYVKAAA